MHFVPMRNLFFFLKVKRSLLNEISDKEPGITSSQEEKLDARTKLNCVTMCGKMLSEKRLGLLPIENYYKTSIPAIIK